MWKELVRRHTDDFRFAEPVEEGTIRQAETDLGVALPDTLCDLLRETNGVHAAYADLIWPLDEIRDTNRAFRSNADFRELYMPFDHLLFFGDHGNGDQFAFAVRGGAIRSDEVFVWDHETDSRMLTASSLDDYLKRALSDTLMR